jgi:hypothetical protein
MQASTLRYARRARMVLCFGQILALGGCNSDPVTQARKVPGESPRMTEPETVSIASTTMQSGFVKFALRQQASVGGFRIAKYPVTWSDYAACVSKGACPEEDTGACSQWSYSPYGMAKVPPYSKKTDRGPAVCIGETGAEAYCKAVGGRLPTMNEWLVAARGEEPTRFAWGNDATSCDQHPLSSNLLDRVGRLAQQPSEQVMGQATVPHVDLLEGSSAQPSDPTVQVLSAERLLDRQPLPAARGGSAAPAPEALPSLACPSTSFDGSELAVGTHPHGASAHGVEDILLAPGELLKTDASSPFNACSPPFDHCVVFGLEPAALDSVESFARVPADGDQPARVSIEHAYAFRCAFGAGTDQ